MDLFSMNEGMEAAPLGFRLQRLEVYNWGTFHDKVWSLVLDGDTSLLTGDVGSGKSTLVDAVLTLLVPPRKVTYNQAADASARERNLRSYVLGYYGQKSTGDGGGRPEALRDRNSYSVLLGVFGDRNYGRTVTLAQVFWFQDESDASPKRFFALAETELSIREQFSRIGNDMRAFRKRLEGKGVHTYDDYPLYGAAFRRIFGIRHQQALDLFQQTVSMKKVDSLTDFVRNNMLEVPDTQGYVDHLLRQFHDLDAAHQAVLRAKAQQKHLEAVDAAGSSYEAAEAALARSALMQKLLVGWFAGKEYEIQNDRLKKLEAHAEELTELKDRKYREWQERQEKLDAVRREMAQNGGQQMEAIQGRIMQQQTERSHRAAAAERYRKYAEPLGFSVPEQEDDFRKNRTLILERKEAAETRQQETEQEAVDLEVSRKEAEEKVAGLKAELESLRQRKSNIPRKFIDLRSRLCRELDLAEAELPFAGELMAVREEEEEWEGALERLLRGFGISLLVPQVHYGEIAGWMERQHLGMRLVYYRVPEYTAPTDLSSLDDRVCGKLRLNEESPYYNWISAELKQRYNHVCCESLQEFQRQEFALTMAGQVKTNGRRHEKDDRHDIRDKQQYVLGFSNVKKIWALEEELQNNEDEQVFFQRKLKELQAERRKLSKELKVLEILEDAEAFSEIDLRSVEKELERLRGELDRLRRENDSYQELEQREKQLVEETDICHTEYEKAVKEEAGNNANREQLMDSVLQLSKRHRAFSEEERQAGYPLLDANASQALESGQYDHARREEQRTEYFSWIDKNSKIAEQERNHHLAQLTKNMAEFRNDFPEQTDELAVSADALNEYRSLLEQLRRDDLPKFEGRFRELLRTNTIREIALFQNHLDELCHEIEERIRMINRSLSEIDYNANRYIQMEQRYAATETVREFRAQLRACTDNAFTGSEDSYSEAKFRQVADIVERLQGREGHTEEDAKWCRYVIDVRNWYSFAAIERWRDKDEEYERYEDSDGKSGGQKEKLAYTILAASIIYNFGLAGKRTGEQSFRFVVIDEAFLKSSDDSARFGLELFKKLDLQLLVVTPLLKISTIEPFVSHVGFVYQNDEAHLSYLRNLTIRELEEERQKNGAEGAGDV